MAVDKLQELYELKNQLADSIRSLGERQSEWSEEDQAEWNETNTRYDDCVTEIEDLEAKKMVSDRMDVLREVDERREQARQTEYGQQRHNRQGTCVTEEMRGRALQGLCLRFLGKSLTTSQEEALYATGLAKHRGREFVIAEPTGMIRSYNCFDSAGKINMTDFRDLHAKNFRADLDTQTPTEGAEWVPSQIFMAELIETMIAFGTIRGVVRNITTATGVPMVLPTVDDTASLGEQVAEEAPVTAVDPTTGEVTWGAFKYGSLVKWSAELLQDSPLNLTSILANLLGQRIGRAQAAHFTTGTGTTEPVGIVTGSTTATAEWDISPTNPYDNADVLIDLQAELDPAYVATGNVMWMFNRKTRAEVRKLKNANGDYIWQPGLRPGDPDMLLGDPMVQNQEMADIGASAVPIVYGDMNSYIIRDAAGMRTKMLDELYAVNDQFGLIVWRRSDGNVANPAAILNMACSAT